MLTPPDFAYFVSVRKIPECSGGFKNVAVAKTRMLQGSHLDITGLSKGKHFFECCIHPWMRMEIDVVATGRHRAAGVCARLHA
jgi:hypothetical protein